MKERMQDTFGNMPERSKKFLKLRSKNYRVIFKIDWLYFKKKISFLKKKF